MTTKAKVKASAKEAEEWEKRRAWEAAWQKSVGNKIFRPEKVMLQKQVVTGKNHTILRTSKIVK